MLSFPTIYSRFINKWLQLSIWNITIVYGIIIRFSKEYIKILGDLEGKKIIILLKNETSIFINEKFQWMLEFSSIQSIIRFYKYMQFLWLCTVFIEENNISISLTIITTIV